MGGTRFVGKALVQELLAKGHEITLFTRGKLPIPSEVNHVKGDRNSEEDLAALEGKSFDVIVDTSGRKLDDTQKVLSHTGVPKYRFLYVSSAGVYSSSDYWPLDETSPLDPNSRHIGKSDTENWLISEAIPFTSFRPTYIYGPGNYNPIEKWFFDRLVHSRPIPIPGEGNWLTQLGHVSDLACAITISLEKAVANNRIYNCSAKKAVSFKGLVKTAAYVCGINPEDVKYFHFDPSNLEPKARKAFPLRIDHFITDISLIENDLDWRPRYNLQKGLKDSYDNDYLLNQGLNPDFSSDSLLAKI